MPVLNYALPVLFAVAGFMSLSVLVPAAGAAYRAAVSVHAGLSAIEE